MNPKDVTAQLITDIKNTNEFKELKVTKCTIDDNSNLKKGLEEFQQMQVRILQTSHTDYEKQVRMIELNKAFENFAKTPEVAQYLKASEEFNKLMETVNRTISTSINQALDN